MTGKVRATTRAAGAGGGAACAISAPSATNERAPLNTRQTIAPRRPEARRREKSSELTRALLRAERLGHADHVRRGDPQLLHDLRARRRHPEAIDPDRGAVEADIGRPGGADRRLDGDAAP